MFDILELFIALFDLLTRFIFESLATTKMMLCQALIDYRDTDCKPAVRQRLSNFFTTQIAPFDRFIHWGPGGMCGHNFQKGTIDLGRGIDQALTTTTRFLIRFVLVASGFSSSLKPCFTLLTSQPNSRQI